jgi:hypothetical protein
MRAIVGICRREEDKERVMKRPKLISKISYRVSEEQRRRIEEEAEEAGMSANDWCRDAALEKLDNLREAAEKSTPAETGNGTGLVVNERVLLEEIARLGYLIEHGFGIQLSADRTTDAEWIRRKRESKTVASRLVEMMFKQRSTGAGVG